MRDEAWERIERARERWNVLRHPFYRRWSAGELSREDLARYAGQYRHAVGAIAAMSEALADAMPDRPEIREHAAEEREHVELWDSFTLAAGGERTATPTPETQACVREWTANGSPLATAARLYAIESGQPEIARVKREGLVDLYGFDEGPATAYFSLHEHRDVDHAADGRRLLQGLDADAADAAVAAAEGALRANWRLLDGV